MSKKNGNTGTELKATETNTELAELQNMMMQDGGVGFEEATKDDFLIPFLRVLQPNSPQLDPAHAKYIEAAKQGQIVNTATGAIMTRVKLLPCAYKREFVEWAPRDSKEGIVARHAVEEGLQNKAEKNDKGKLMLDNGNSLVDTRYFACLLLGDDGVASPVIVAMASTQIKVARSWMTRMDNFKFTAPNGTRVKEPLFARIWPFKTVQERNAQGTWYSWNIEADGSPVSSRELYQAAKDFRENFLSGAAKIDESAENEAGSGTGDTIDGESSERVM